VDGHDVGETRTADGSITSIIDLFPYGVWMTPDGNPTRFRGRPSEKTHPSGGVFGPAGEEAPEAGTGAIRRCREKMPDRSRFRRDGGCFADSIFRAGPACCHRLDIRTGAAGADGVGTIGTDPSEASRLTSFSTSSRPCFGEIVHPSGASPYLVTLNRETSNGRTASVETVRLCYDERAHWYHRATGAVTVASATGAGVRRPGGGTELAGAYAPAGRRARPTSTPECPRSGRVARRGG
jgi:hypothetical protein